MEINGVKIDYNTIFIAIYLVLVLSTLFVLFVRLLSRKYYIWSYQRRTGNKLVTIVHTNHLFLFLPIPAMLSLADANKIIELLEKIPSEKPIDILLHTPGGYMIAADQIAKALKGHIGKVTVYIPRMAMSAGTILSIAADEIVMTHHTMLGQIDPQLGSMVRGALPAVSIIKAMRTPNPNRDDSMLVLADMADKAMTETMQLADEILDPNINALTRTRIINRLASGKTNHGVPIYYNEAKSLGLNVTLVDKMPKEMLKLLKLYNAKSDDSSVEFVKVNLNILKRR